MNSITLDVAKLKESNEATLLALLELSESTALKEVWAPIIHELRHAGCKFVERFALKCDADDIWDALCEKCYLSSESAWSETLVGKWCQAKGFEALDRDAEALSRYESLSLFSLNERDSMPVALDAAHVACRLKKPLLAERFVAIATQNSNDYNTLQRAAKLYKRIDRLEQVNEKNGVLRCALLFSSTTQFLEPLLRAKARSHGIFLEIYSCDFNNFSQAIYDAESDLYHFKPDIVILGRNWRDLNFSGLSDDPEKWVLENSEEIQQHWRLILSRLNCRILQQGFDLPEHTSDGQLSASGKTGRLRAIRALNASLVENKLALVSMIDFSGLQARVGFSTWSDERMWFLARQHPAPDGLPFVVSEYLAFLRAITGKTKKLLVLDLDNTLWGGVIGEDGLGGIKIGQETPQGESFRAFQEYLLELKSRGVLLAVCSKNNAYDAKLPFERHDGMVLSLDDFVAFKANWQSKDASIIQIAEELNLGLDSFVFVDDNAAERALIRRKLPEVTVIELPDEPADYKSALEQGRWFEAIHVSDEDANRTQDYCNQAQRRNLQKSASSLEDYLESLGMRASQGVVDSQRLDRIAQLVHRTNQFNLTSRRHSLEALSEMINTACYWTQWFSLSDQFGDQGIVGLVLVEIREKEWHIDTFLMSCRAIGRGLEDYMLNRLMQSAKEAKAETVVGYYESTAKNEQVASFYSDRSFTVRSNTESLVVYEIEVSEFEPKSTTIDNKMNA